MAISLMNKCSSRSKKGVLLKVFCFLFSTFFSTLNVHSAHETDCTLSIRIANDNRLLEIPVRSELLKRIPFFKTIFDHDEKLQQIHFPCDNQEQASALMRVIGLSHHKLPPNQIAHAILFSHQFDRTDLCLFFVKFLHSEIKAKLCSDNVELITLDRLNEEELLFFINHIYKNRTIQEPWFENIKSLLNIYLCFITLKQDARIRGQHFSFEPNIYAQISNKILFDREESLKKEKEETVAQRRETELALLRARAAPLAEDIYEKFLSDISKTQKLSTQYSYKVPKSCANEALRLLRERLPTYSIHLSPNFGDLNKDSLLWTSSCLEDSVGLCCAKNIGLVCCLICLPLQWATCDYFLWCGRSDPDQCCCSHHLAIVTSRCLYEAGSCNSRWLVIVIDNEAKLPALNGPSQQSMDWET